jgi:exodeoxyribonuclease VII large subunit
LAAFDSFSLAKAVANMPLPVFTGIGHDVDETVLDLVAHSSLKTPTAVADFIVNHNLQFESKVVNLGAEIKQLALVDLGSRSANLQFVAQHLGFQLKNGFQRQSQMLDYIGKELPLALKSLFTNSKKQLNNLEETVKLLDPETALKRGFALVFQQGKHVSAVDKIAAGLKLTVKMNNGSFDATVETIKR